MVIVPEHLDNMALLEEIMLDVMFDAPAKGGGVCRVDGAAVRKGSAAIKKR